MAKAGSLIVDGYRVEQARRQGYEQQSIQLKQAQKELDEIKMKTDHWYSSAMNCRKNPEDVPDFWSFLPDDLKKQTYKKDIVSIGSSTYDIFPLQWSENCKKVAFLLELVARGGGAYDDADFQNRALYILDTDAKKLIIVKRISSKDSYLDTANFYENYWIRLGIYVFTEITRISNSEFVGRIYEYDPQNDTLRLKD